MCVVLCVIRYVCCVVPIGVCVGCGVCGLVRDVLCVVCDVCLSVCGVLRVVRLGWCLVCDGWSAFRCVCRALYDVCFVAFRM